jgi:excinuclease UvrABC nuclease subunit
MDHREPDVKMSGSDFIKMNSSGVYAWIRGGKALYVGSSVEILARVASHNVIGRADAVMATDHFLFWCARRHEDYLVLEQQIESNLKPVFSTPLQRGELKSFKCLSCKMKFKQKRWWQKYCSTKCRNGGNPRVRENKPDAR